MIRITQFCNNKTTTNMNFTNQNIILSDIKSVSYSSDGKIFVGTFWLTPADDKPSFNESLINKNNSKLRYLIYFDVDTNLDSGLNGSDYANWIEMGKKNAIVV